MGKTAVEEAGWLLGFERVSATASVGCIGIVDHESFTHDRLDIVYLGSVQVLGALLVHQNLDPMAFDHAVVVVLLIKRQTILEAAATAA
jgi:hypothetical protein